MSTQSISGSSSSRGFFRFSIRQLLLWTAAVGVACIALRNASSWWVSLTFWLTTVALLGAVLLALNRQDRSRAYWMGFALCGSVYLMLVIHAWDIRSNNQSFSNPLHCDNLPTTKVSTWLYHKLKPALTLSTAQANTPASLSISIPALEFDTITVSPGMEVVSQVTPGGSTFMSGSPDPSGDAGMSGTVMFGGTMAMLAAGGPSYVRENYFVDVSHSFWALLLAALGGWLSQILFMTGRRREPARN